MSKSQMVIKQSCQSSGINLLVLLVIALHEDREGECAVSLKDLAIETRLCRRKVIQSIKQLERDGELRIMRRTKGDGGSDVNQYIALPNPQRKRV